MDHPSIIHRWIDEDRRRVKTNMDHGLLIELLPISLHTLMCYSKISEAELKSGSLSMNRLLIAVVLLVLKVDLIFGHLVKMVLYKQNMIVLGSIYRAPNDTNFLLNLLSNCKTNN